MRGLHKVALLVILCGFWAIPAEAYDWAGKAGWGNGNSGVVGRFYPPTPADTRARLSGEWYFAKDVWAEDISNALNERAYFSNQSHNESLARDTNGNVRIRWDYESLEEIKTLAKFLLTTYICLTNRNDGGTNYFGLYDSWYGQFSTTNPATQNPYTNFNEYIVTIIHPPNWQITNSATANSFWAWTKEVGNALPTNYFDYTPTRFLGATAVAFTNEYTASGGPLPFGKSEWTTLDYGWQGMITVLRAMQDLKIEPDGLFEIYNSVTNTSGSAYFTSPPLDDNCAMPAFTSEDVDQTFLSLGKIRKDFEYNARAIELRKGNMSTNHPCAFLANATYSADDYVARASKSRFIIGVSSSSAAEPVIEQLELEVGGEFQWYGAGYYNQSSERLTGTIGDVDVEFFQTNKFLFGYTLQVFVDGAALTPTSVAADVFYGTSKVYAPDADLPLICPDPSAWSVNPADANPIEGAFPLFIEFVESLCPTEGDETPWYFDELDTKFEFLTGSESILENEFDFSLIWRPHFRYSVQTLPSL